MSDITYYDPWKRSAPDPELGAFMDSEIDVMLAQYDKELDSRRFDVVAKSLLLGATVMAPLLIKPSKAEAGVMAIPNGTKVVVIGDSLTVGREKAGLRDSLVASGFDPLFISSYGGRPLVLPGCDTNPVKDACYEFSDGVREVLKAAQPIDDADIVMLNLSTNDPEGLVQERLFRTIDTIIDVGSKQDGKPPVIIVPEVFGNNPRISSDVKGQVIHNVANDYNARGIKVVVPDYKEFVDNVVRPSGQMSSDEVHLTGTGYKSLVAFDIEQLTSVAQSLVVPESVPTAPPTPEPVDIPAAPKPDSVDPAIVSLSAALSAAPVRAITLPTIDSYTPPVVPKKPTYDLNMVPLQAVSDAKKQIAVSFALPAITAPQPVLAEQSTLPLLQEKPLLRQPDLQPVPSAPETVPQDAIPKNAAAANIFYDPITGRAMTTFKSFFDSAEIADPQMRHGFKEPRDLPDTGPYVHANTDWRAPAGTTFVSPVPAKVIRYDDQYPGQKKGVGNSLVLVMGNDSNGNPITIQATHFSEIFVKTGDIVIPGQPLAKSGETGIAYGAHDSVGMSSDGSLEPYTNLAHSLNPIEYFDFDYSCAPSAQDGSGELCASDGSPIAIPVSKEVLDYLGLPEYVDVRATPTVDPQSSQSQSLAETLAQTPDAAVIDLPSVQQDTTIYTATDPIITPTDPVQEPAQDRPPTFVETLQPAEETNTQTELPQIDTVTEPLDPSVSNQPDSPTETPPPAEEQIQEPTPPPADTPIPQDKPLPPAAPEQPPAQPNVDPNDATKGDVPKRMYDFYAAQEDKLTYAGIIGLMANFASESGLNPERTQNNWHGTCAAQPERLDPSKSKGEGGTRGYGFGLPQMTIESRQLGLQAYADQTGRPWYDLDVQLEYTMIELRTPFFDNVLKVLQTTNDIDEATSVVLKYYENPAVHNHEERRAKAHELDKLIQQGNFASIDVGCD